jgi:spore coat polysaccharide biosynthesis protein SpsF (cytidylyltransferase family)
VLLEMSTQSTRLPQKWKKNLCNYPLWEWCAEGARRITTALKGTLILKLPESILEDPLRFTLLEWKREGEYLIQYGGKGEGDDLSFLRTFPGEWVLRLTGDNPFLPVELATSLCRVHNQYTLLCTHSDRFPFAFKQYPPGLDMELFQVNHLYRVGWSISRLYQEGYPFILLRPNTLEGLPSCTIDTQEDLQRVRKLVQRGGWTPAIDLTLKELQETAHFVQEEGEKGTI